MKEAGYTKVFVGNDTELTELIEEIRRHRGVGLEFVFLEKSRLSDKLTLQLLKHYAEQHGVDVKIATVNPRFARVATLVGFDVTLGATVKFFDKATSGHDVAKDVVLLEQKAEPIDSEPTVASKASPIYKATQSRVPSAASNISVSGYSVPKTRVRVAAGAIYPPKTGRKVKGLMLAAGGLILILGIAGLFLYVPTATIILQARASSYSTTLTLRGYPGAHVSGFTFPTQTRTYSFSGSGTFYSTGTKNIPAAAATGSITITYTNQPPLISPGEQVEVPAGTCVQDSSGSVQFDTQQTAVFSKVGDTATVPIQAMQPGSSGNVPANTIVEFCPSGSSLNYNQFFSVSQPNPTSGGENATTKPEITAQDVANAKSELTADMEYRLLGALESAAPSGWVLAGKDAVHYSSTFTTNHKVGDLVASFNATEKLSGTGIYYQPVVVKQILTSYYQKHLPGGYQLASEPIKTSYSIESSSSSGDLTLTAKVSSYIVPKFNYSAIRHAVAGKTVTEAKQYLSHLKVTGLSIQQSAWHLPIMPVVPSRIFIRVIVSGRSASTS